MILRNLNIYGKDGKKAIHIENGKIKSIAGSYENFPFSQNETVIDFDDAMAIPGFINSHDHLDFNLFPQLGNRIYSNYTGWGKDIHQQNKETINEVLKVPQPLRIKWGLYKNLINGVTTVVNHGEKLQIEDNLITVLQPAALHSPAFEKNWKWKLNNPFLKEPVVMHIGEGTDAAAKKEIDKVRRWNFRKKKIVAVHGVAMNEKQAGSFYGLVWCPASNYFLLNQTADVEKLKNRTKIVFGTDSTLTASWNFWDHIRAAKRSGVNEKELLPMLTIEPAKLWKLNAGELAVGKDADIVIVEKKDFFELSPEDILMVVRNGEIKLFDERLAGESSNLVTGYYEIIEINRRKKYVQGKISEVIKTVNSIYPQIKLFF